MLQILLFICPLYGQVLHPKKLSAILILTSLTDRSFNSSHQNSDRYPKDLVEVNAPQKSVKGKSLFTNLSILICISSEMEVVIDYEVPEGL